MVSLLIDVFSSAPEPIIGVDAAGIVRAWNHAAETSLRLPANSALGRKLTELEVGPGHAISELLRDTQTQGKAILRRGTGGELPAKIKTVPVYGEDNKHRGWQIFIQDLSELVQAQAQIADSQGLLDSALEFALFRLDANGKIASWNASAEHLLNYAEDEALGRPIEDVLAVKNCVPGTQESALDAAVAAGQAHCERWQARKNQSTFWATSTFTAERDQNGALIGFTVAIRDCTQRKRAEDLLASQKRWLNALLDCAADGIMSTDKDSHITAINPCAEQLTGWRRHEALGRALTEVLTLESENRAPEDIAQRALRERKGHHINTGRELRTRAGERRTIAYSIAPVFTNPSAHPEGTVIIFRDISEQKLLQENIMRVDKLSALGVLGAGVAHQFNNLLTGLFGNITLARMSLRPNDPATEHLEEAERQFVRARNLAQRFLTFTEGGKPLKSRGLLHDLLADTMRLVFEGANVRLLADVAPDLYYIEFDRAQLGQAIANILLNAREATPEHGLVEVRAFNETLGELQMDALHGGRFVVISVQDSGPGIPKDLVPKVLDPFFTTKPGYIGLGLSAAHSIVRNHEGHLDIKSTPGAGTTVRIYLPASDTAH